MNGKRLQKILGIVATALLLAALGLMFLPLLKTSTGAGEEILFYGSTLLFGGKIDLELPSGVYSFSFQTNIYLLITTQTFLLGAISCLLAKQSSFNRVFSLVLSIAGIVLLALSPTTVARSSTLSQKDFAFAYGFILSVVCAGLAVLIEAGLLCFALIGSKKKKQ